MKINENKELALKAFNIVYQESLESHENDEIVENICPHLKNVLRRLSNNFSFRDPKGWSYIKSFFRPSRYEITTLYLNDWIEYEDCEINVWKEFKIENIPEEDQKLYFWFPVELEYNLRRLEILKRTIDELHRGN